MGFALSRDGLKILILCEAQKKFLVLGQSVKVKQSGNKYFLTCLFISNPWARIGVMEKRAEGYIRREWPGEEAEEGNILFISPFEAVQSDMTPVFWSVVLGLGGNQGQESVMKKRTKE